MKSKSASGLRLLPKQALLAKTAVGFHPIEDWLERLRFRLIHRLLPPQPVARLLEVGYGHGELMPTLAQHCQMLYGIDTHTFHVEVAARLQHFQVNAQLSAGKVESLPFEDSFFDVIVVKDLLDSAIDLERACQELQRVLRPQGCLILWTPLWHSSKQKSSDVKADQTQLLISTLLKYFIVKHRQAFPPIGSVFFCVCTVLRLAPLPNDRFRLLRSYQLSDSTPMNPAMN